MVKRTDGVPPPPFPPAPPNPFRRAAPTSTPKCMVCTTPTRCGAPALHTKGPRCIGRADGKDDCDCLNACGDDPWIESGRSMPCEHRRETQARIAALTQAAPMESVLIDGIAYQTPAPVAAELLRLHIDARQPAPQQEAREPLTDSQIMASIGRNAGKPNTSISESRPLGQQWDQVCNLVRDIFRERYAPAPQQEAQEPVMIYHGGCTIDCGEHGHHNVELLRMIPAGSKLYTAPQPSPASQGDALPREEFAWLVVREACETEPADEDDPECIRILRRDLKSSVLAAFLRHDAARAAQEGK